MKGQSWTGAELQRIKAHVASGMNAREISLVSGRTRKAIISAVQKHSLGPWVGKPGSRPGDTNHIPADFAEMWKTKSQRELAEHYGRSTSTINTWSKRLGLWHQRGAHIVREAPEALPVPKPAKPLRIVKRNAYQTAPVDRAFRDTSHAGQAADFLRRFGAVYRCNERGGADANGSRWRRGSAILTSADIIERAERLGWDANAWRRVA